MPLTNPDARLLLVPLTIALEPGEPQHGMRAATSTVDRQRGPATVAIVQRVTTAVVSVSTLLLGYGVIAMGAAFGGYVPGHGGAVRLHVAHRD